jgi:kynurenine 3-monooxygenase
MRTPSSRQALAQRSVNLAISSRGLAALYAVNPNLMNKVLEAAIPMKGRMLHTLDGKTESQYYDRNGQVILNILFYFFFYFYFYFHWALIFPAKCINSIDRGLLNEILLQEAVSSPGIDVFFRHKLLTANFDARTLTFFSSEKNQNVDIYFDLCVGTDGSYSNVRRQMMRVTR